ncbi:helicase-related protein [Priestia aryabhattai]
MNLKTNIENREILIDSVYQELIGPIKTKKESMQPLNITKEVIFNTKEESYKKYYNENTDEEILQINPPLIQYSAGILFPYEQDQNDIIISENELNAIEDEEEPSITKEGLKSIEQMEKRQVSEYDSEDFQGGNVDLMPQKNDFSPSSLALSYYVLLADKDVISISLSGGIYKKFPVKVVENNSSFSWWGREKVEPTPVELTGECLKRNNNTPIRRLIPTNGLLLEVMILSRLQEANNTFLITVSLTNRTNSNESPIEERCLFQSEMFISLNNHATSNFLPYRSDGSRGEFSSPDEDEESNALLYRNAKTYALGHGCSANWLRGEDKTYIKQIFSTFLPQYEATSMTPNITDENGDTFSISMLDLAGLIPGMDSIENILNKLVSSYESWIGKKENEVSSLELNYQSTATCHLVRCRKAAERMRLGIEYIKKDPKIREAFMLANHAMAIQQVIGTNLRSGEILKNEIDFDQKLDTYDIPSYDKILDAKRGKWRAFQIAFFILSIPSVSNGKALDRETVDLIWFPTGGGKTEAYLGVAAFSMFLRRLRDKNDTSTDVIMRYTLRLLTTDQFQRSSRLICSMDMLRRRNEVILGEVPFSIGIWLGSQTTPNQNAGSYGAKEQLKQWKEGNDRKSFITKSCPWCGAVLGKYYEKKTSGNFSNNKGGLMRNRRLSSAKKSKSDKIFHIKGYEYTNNQLVVKCPDKKCPFHNEIPVYIVDETIYEKRPTFIIGTIDKFAMLSWKPEARNLFGLDMSGNRVFSPPNLIIQDELHLISGPLGSMTGMYEILIEELSTDYRNNGRIKPKIICSTATIRRFREQILNLYGRESSTLFPNPGISHEDSFFARVSLNEEGNPARGRKYVGVYSPIIGMQMLQVKVYSILLQKVMEFKKDENSSKGKDPRDPFWTLLSFYNSLRELGGSLTLLQTDIPSYLNQVRKKHNITDKKYTRWLNSFLELTSRLDSGEVADVIQKLKVEVEQQGIDVCLASNIIEVGVDIDRLSLMTVVGQPKNTAQYIQVTGRVGRRWDERPGLVLTLYKTGISRDKSHFEHFREYHERLYSNVEPTSVTPYSDPSINRALYGVIIAYIRQMHDESIASSPTTVKNYTKSIKQFKTLLMERVEKVDPGQLKTVEGKFDYYVKRITDIGASNWVQQREGGYFLMHQFGEYIQDNFRGTALPVPTSMRNVDASCRGEVSNIYQREEVEASI